MIECLIAQSDTHLLSTVLTEAYLSSGPELSQDVQLRRRVLERIAIAPASEMSNNAELERFPPDEIAPVVNEFVGTTASSELSECHDWLVSRRGVLDVEHQAQKLKKWRERNPWALSELVYFVHREGPAPLLMRLASDVAMYESPGPTFPGFSYSCQAEIALLGLMEREDTVGSSPEFDSTLLQIFRILSIQKESMLLAEAHRQELLKRSLGLGDNQSFPRDPSTWPEFASLARRLATQYERAEALKEFANALQRENARVAGEPAPAHRPRSKTSAKATVSRGRQKRGRH
jgi:hypothetical protein